MRGLLGILSDWLTAIKGTIVVRAHRSKWTTRVAFGGGTVLMATALAVFWLQAGSDLEPGSASLDGSGSGQVDGSVGDPDHDRTSATDSTEAPDPTGAGPAGQTEPSTPPGKQQDARSGTAPTGGPASGSDAGGADPAGAGVPGSPTESGDGSTPTGPSPPQAGTPSTTPQPSPTTSPTTSPAPSPTSTAPPPPPPPPSDDEPPGDGSPGLVGGLVDAVGGLLGEVVGVL